MIHAIIGCCFYLGIAVFSGCFLSKKEGLHLYCTCFQFEIPGSLFFFHKHFNNKDLISESSQEIEILFVETIV